MTLSENEIRLLERFIERSKRIANSGLIRTGFKPGHKITFLNGAIDFQGTELDEDHFAALLVLVRPYISEGEKLNIDKTFKWIESIKSEPKIIARAKRVQRDHISRLASQTTVQMIGDRVYDNKALYALTVNSKYFHDDLNKAKELKNLGDIGELMGREQVIEYLYAHVWTIFELTPILESLLGVKDPLT